MHVRYIFKDKPYPLPSLGHRPLTRYAIKTFDKQIKEAQGPWIENAFIKREALSEAQTGDNYHG